MSLCHRHAATHHFRGRVARARDALYADGPKLFRSVRNSGLRHWSVNHVSPRGVIGAGPDSWIGESTVFGLGLSPGAPSSVAVPEIKKQR